MTKFMAVNTFIRDFISAYWFLGEAFGGGECRRSSTSPGIESVVVADLDKRLLMRLQMN